MDDPTDPSLPTTKQAAFLDSSLYSSFDLEGWKPEDLVDFLYGGGTFDAWCDECGKGSLFTIKSQLPGYGEKKKDLPFSDVIVVSSYCGRGDSSYSACRSALHIVLFKSHNTLRKIGQIPSAADLELGSLDEAFEKQLDPLKRRELGTAIGLHAHGVGIGSFVYLRRIFEALIEESHAEAREQKGWNEDEYKRARTVERVGLLKDYLPRRLVDSAKMYSILSKGIHELSEPECREKFGLLKAAIELILRERHEADRYDQITKRINSKSD